MQSVREIGISQRSRERAFVYKQILKLFKASKRGSERVTEKENDSVEERWGEGR